MKKSIYFLNVIIRNVYFSVNITLKKHITVLEVESFLIKLRKIYIILNIVIK